MSETEKIIVKVPGGQIVATKATDAYYPGIDIEFISDNEENNIVSRPRILFEKPLDGELRALTWSDTKNEDYTEEIIFE